MRKLSTLATPLLVVFLFTAAVHAEESAGAETSESGGDTHWIIKSEGHHTRPYQLSVALGLPEYWGVGAMGWFTLPLVHDGFIPRVNDSFDLEFGLIYGVNLWLGWYGFYGFGGAPPMFLTPLVAARWNFFLTGDWTVFAMVKLGVGIGLNYPGLTHFVGGFIVGGQYRLTKDMSLRLETGWPYTSVGLAWDL